MCNIISILKRLIFALLFLPAITVRIAFWLIHLILIFPASIICWITTGDAKWEKLEKINSDLDLITNFYEWSIK